jgi:hypothetical protein
MESSLLLIEASNSINNNSNNLIDRIDNDVINNVNNNENIVNDLTNNLNDDKFVEIKDEKRDESPKKRLKTDNNLIEPKLEQRLGGILCCAVCLDLPKSGIFQV